MKFLFDIPRRIRHVNRAIWGFLGALFGWLINSEKHFARVLRAITSPMIWAYEMVVYKLERIRRRFRVWLDLEEGSNSTRLDFERDQAVLERLEAKRAREAGRRGR